MVLRAERKGIELKFLELCTKRASEQELEIYDLEYLAGSQTLRLFVMDPKTKSAVLDDCVKMDRALTEDIDTLEWMPPALVLEVSSPGLFRNLRTVEHFTGAHGETIALVTRAKLDEENFPGIPKKIKGQKKFIATLVSSDEEEVELKVDNFTFKLKLADIKKANLETVLNHD